MPGKRKRLSAGPDHATPRLPSDECQNCSCTSGKTRGDLLRVLQNVHSQPAYAGRIAARGPLNMESVQVALVEDYLAHSRASAHLHPKQVRLREALRRVAAKLDMPFLAQFNTKTTPLRTFGKALWDGVGMEEPKKKTTELQQTQKKDLDRVLGVIDRVATAFPTSPLHCEGRAQIRNLLDRSTPTSEDKRAQYRAQLETDGIVLVPRFVSEDIVCHLLSRVGSYTQNKTCTKLTETSATGSNGIYYDSNFACEGLVTAIQERIFDQLCLGEKLHCTSLPLSNTKGILLCYTLNAENWTHQDDNAHFAYQALLMLSEPKVDFNDGKLYVLNGTDDAWSQTSMTFQGRGDVVVFRSNGKFFHGMSRVSQGTKAITSRIALGLFHKL